MKLITDNLEREKRYKKSYREELIQKEEQSRTERTRHEEIKRY